MELFNLMLPTNKISLVFLIQLSTACAFLVSYGSFKPERWRPRRYPQQVLHIPLEDWKDDEGINPIPYKNPTQNEINEEDPPDPPRESIVMVWPGTKWCGPGNIAANYHDLGYYEETDRCCRAHDNCPDLIPAYHSAHGINNTDFYTKLNCKCDDTFHMCLKNSKDGIGDRVGITYFDVIGTQCFRLDYPITRCVRSLGIIRKRCVQYEFDTTKSKIYQWFDVRPYKNIS